MIKHAKIHIFLLLVVTFITLQLWRVDANRYLLGVGSDNLLSIYQLNSLELVEQLPVSPNSVSMQLDIPSNRLFVASAQGRVEAVDIANGDIDHVIQLDEQINGMVLIEDEPLLVAANRNNAFLSVYNWADNAFLTQVPVGFSPVNLSVDAEHHLLYAISQHDSRVDVIDTVSMTRQFSVLLEPDPFMARKHPVKNQLWIGHAGSGLISVLNTVALEVMRRIDVSRVPSAVKGSSLVDMVFSNDGRVAVIAMEGADKLVMMDTATFQVIAYINTDTAIDRLVASNRAPVLYASSAVDKRLFRFRLDTKLLDKQVGIDTDPQLVLLAE